jgi:ketosteroid isomerase-like protein
MAKIQYFAAALVFTACAGSVPANGANAANPEKITPPAPTKDALVTLEKSAYEAWKSKDAKFWDTFLSDKFVGNSSSGRLDKASLIQQNTRGDCEIKSYALSDEQIQPLGNDAALITHKTTVDGTCNGQIIPPSSWVASVYVRDGDRWKAAFHAEAPVVDPKATPAQAVDGNEMSQKGEAKAAKQDAGTEALFANEKNLWEAWRTQDVKKIGALTASDISFINIFGTHFATKAAALKDWSGTYCDVKSISFTDVAGTMLSPTVGILTFKATADGTCYGQKVGPIWGTSVYVKHGGVWKWAFGINLPARREGVEAAGLCPGRALCIPRGTAHRFYNLGHEDVKQLAVISPAIMGPAYFRDAAEAMNAATTGGPPDREKMMEIFRRHGMTLAAPPPASQNSALTALPASD